MFRQNTDHAGHKYGPDAPETRDAVHQVDKMIGILRDKLKATGLPVDLIVTADHGMIKAEMPPVVLDKFADLSHFKTEGALLYADNEADAEHAYEQFRAHVDPRFTAYRRADVPKSLNYDSRVSEGDPVIIANGPYAVYAHDPTRAPNVGSHGFDPQRVPQMKAIFYAEGPDIKAGVALPTFDNIGVFSDRKSVV